ncbi:putative beta-D-xylosidase 5 [Morella rubra]|uniref:Putative beta-D-xylosidase 5 n=1 Tax=Morella rubra TaxID=262757 RepID=A0A6A1W861_9ROSI|nr:putative beta-D-xylosidase 5 [Morella rubra]
MGCGDIACRNDTFIGQALNAAKKADATVILAGLDLSVKAEGLDRVNLVLPGYQTQLINQVVEVAKGPVILVILSAGGVDISFVKEHENIKAILWAGYPGEEGGGAIADEDACPLHGYEASYGDEFPMTSMPLSRSLAWGTRGGHANSTTAFTDYPFGYGLSYTKFRHRLLYSKRPSLHINLNNLQHCRDLTYASNVHKPSCPAVLIDDLKCQQNIEFQVEVKNVGLRDGSGVIIVYSRPPQEIVGAPLKQVIGFQRVGTQLWLEMA